MTFFEHAMLGGTLTLAVGLDRRHGWRIAVMAGIAAMLPDWDGLTLIFGGAAYDMSHRIWGHNLLVAAILGGLFGLVEFQFNGIGRVRNWFARRAARVPSSEPPENRIATARTPFDAIAWCIVGALASLSHLAADLFYSSHPWMSDWPLQLLWPFSRREFALRVVHWGDVGATIIFVLEMFALYHWPRRGQRIACLSLAMVCWYVAIRAMAG
jgi:membrane-bound metal-dependent hydrolase YbcI (DUF457 family)